MNDYGKCDECPTIEQYNNMNKIIPNFYKNPPVKVKKSDLKKCDCCNNTLLCQIHTVRAIHYGKKYMFKDSYIMCDQCCWNEIS